MRIRTGRLKRKLSLFLIFCMVLIQLPADKTYASPDPKPGTGSIFVDGTDLLNSDETEYPEGISYYYVGGVNVITVSGAAISLGHSDMGKYSGIYANDVGDVEVLLVGDNNRINISNEGNGVGIFIGGGNLTFYGSGSLTIESDGSSINLDAYGNPGKAITFSDAVTVIANNRIFTEGGDVRPVVNIIDTANVTSHGIECGNDNTPFVEAGANYTNTETGGGDPGGGDPGGGDPGPGPESLYVNGVNILNEEYDDYIEGLTHEYDSETDTHIIELNGVHITSGDISPGKQVGIHAPSIGNLEIRVLGDNSIIIPNEADPNSEADPPMINGIGILVSNGNLTISGDGTLDIDTGDRSIILDAHGSTEPMSITFKDSVTVIANNRIFTEGGDVRPVVNIIDTANVTSHGIECGNDNTPFVEAGANYTNTETGGGDPGGGDPGGGDPGPGPESLYVNGVNILNEEYDDYIEGLTHEYDSETDTHIIELNGVHITSGDISPGKQVGIHAPSIGNLEIRVMGDNSIIIPNEPDPNPEADPPMINGIGIFVRNGNLTISGDGTLDIDTGDRSIILDAHGATEPLAITFKESVVVTANNQISTEGDEVDDRPVVNIIDAANVTSHGIECGNDNTPIVDEGASYTNTETGGGDPYHPDEPFRLSVGGVDLVINDEVQDVEIPNLEIIYFEHVDQYSLILKGGTYGGIYTEGSGILGIYVEGDSVVSNLTDSGFEEYSIVLSAGAEITPFSMLKERDPSETYHADNTLTLTGGILSRNHLAFKDNIEVNIGSSVARVNRGIVGDESLRIEAVNPRNINIWAENVGVENVNADEGFKLGDAVEVNIYSNSMGAYDTCFLVGEGSSLNMEYSDRGNFASKIYKWDYLDMAGPLETYANMPYTIVDDLSPGTHIENKYDFEETSNTYRLTSTARPLYTLGYNYDNDRDGIVDNPDEEIKNGRLSIKGATGVCHGDSEGFVDYRFEAGSVVTIELLPDYGYQYQAGTLSYNLVDKIDTTPGETRAYYTFIMPEGHVHLYAGFIPTSDIIQNNTPVISDAVVDIGQNNIHGNVAFEIDEGIPSTGEIEVISDLAGTKVAGAYLDLNLNEYIAKAGTDDAWITELNDLDEPVTIDMELSEDLIGKSQYSVIRIHNGEATVLNTGYSNGVITFETDKFSTYAIVYKESPTNPPAGPSGPSGPSYNPIVTPEVTPEPEDNNKFNFDIMKPSQDESDDSMTISSALFKQAIEAKEEVTVTVRDEDDNELYTWTFDTGEATDSEKKITDVNLSIDILPLSENEKINEELTDNQGFILSFGHNGDLPITARLRIYVGNFDNIKPGMKIYLYHYNKENGKLETLPFSSGYTVDEDGYITINIIHCSDYVVLNKEAKADQISSLRNQIDLSIPKDQLYVGGTRDNTTNIDIKLPPTLMLVKDLKEKTSSKAIGGVVASFESSNKKVLKVDKDGTITAVGEGEAVITACLTLYSGKVKTVKFKIKVDDAHIEFKVAKSVMDVNSSYTFKAKAYGFYSKDITWSIDDEAILSIDKTSGKARAKSKGTVYITAKAKDVTKRIKVTVR